MEQRSAQAQGTGVPAPRAGDRRRADRRGGDRRQGQAATLHHRRATDVRMDGAQASALLARRALEQRTREPRPPAPPVVDPVPRVVDLDDAAPPPPPVQVRCPECGEPCDRLWLVRHVVEAHPGWP